LLTDIWQCSISRSVFPQSRSPNFGQYSCRRAELFTLFGDTTLSDAEKQARIQQIHIVTEHRVWSLLTHEQRKLMMDQPAPPPRRAT